MSRAHLKSCNYVVRQWLDRLSSPSFHDDLPAKMIQEFVQSLPISTALTPYSGNGIDMEVLMIFQTLRNWQNVRGVPTHTDIVMPFKMHSTGAMGIFNIGFLLCNIYRSFISDGESKVEICALSFKIGIDYGVGFAAFAGVSPAWIERAETTPMFDVVPGLTETFVMTWPLCRDDLSTTQCVHHTLKESRSTPLTNADCGFFSYNAVFVSVKDKTSKSNTSSTETYETMKRPLMTPDNRDIKQYLHIKDHVEGTRRLKKRRLNSIRHVPIEPKPRIAEDGAANSFWFPFCYESSNIVVLNELLKFDNDATYGPGAGSTRLERYKRALLLGLHPPEHLLWILENIDRDLNHPWRLTRITGLLL
ncbi:hypothetical protein F5879DRAFT_995949 [Lentinula edodes]|nr:hypothetical protein F5879DRAFT_995949 [Lentinula edodes]